MKLLWWRKEKLIETVEQNALRFVEAVNNQAHEKRLVEMLPHPGWRGYKSEEYDWPLMVNLVWRRRVMTELFATKVPVKDARFHAPDALAGWTFTAISTTPTPRLATLTLEDFV